MLLLLPLLLAQLWYSIDYLYSLYFNFYILKIANTRLFQKLQMVNVIILNCFVNLLYELYIYFEIFLKVL